MRTLQSVTIVAAATGIVIAASAVAHAQEKFPKKPIRLVVGNVAGSQPDTLARLIGQKMSENWRQAVLVDNRPGAGGTLGAGVVARATPDGHTLLLTPTFAISAALQPNLPYDPLKDFAGVTQIGVGTTVLVVAPALGIKSVKELIALAKAQPGKLIFGSSATGTGPQLSGARFNLAADIKVVTVAFKGGPEATIEILAGRTHYSFQTLIVAMPFIKEGKLLALAVSTPQRLPILPEVPALAETMPDIKRPETSTGLLAPAQTPRSILAQIGKEIARVLALPDIKGRLQGMGFVLAPTTPEEYDKILREQITAISKLAKDAGLRTK